MRYLELGMDRHHYSIAFRRYRNDILKDNIGWMLTVLVAAVFGFVMLRALRRRKHKDVPDDEGGVMDA
jgi:hypothetical protein